MDYGLVRGNNTIKSKTGPLITNKDGLNCYLLIVDKFSRHIWIFLFANKSPPIAIVTAFLANHGIKTGIRQALAEQGGELTKIISFCKCIQD